MLGALAKDLDGLLQRVDAVLLDKASTEDARVCAIVARDYVDLRKKLETLKREYDELQAAHDAMIHCGGCDG